MPSFGVTPQKDAELRERMAACHVCEADLRETFVASGGPGGQNVNKTATCVVLRHEPTGIEVKMQKARSQALNRFYARRRLCELIEAQTLGNKSPQAVQRDKVRKQKARRKRRAKDNHNSC